jgi:hypothetical protein
VEVSTDNGRSRQIAAFIGPDEPLHLAAVAVHLGGTRKGRRYADVACHGHRRAPSANACEMDFWGYGNNGIQEHAVKVRII